MINSASQSPEFRPPQAQIAPELSQIDQKVASLEPHIHKSGPIPTDVWKSHVLNRLTIPELFCVARVSKSNLLHVYAKLQVDYPFLLPKNEPNALVAVREAKDLYKELIAASKNALLQAVRKREGFRDFMTLENVLKSDMIGTISRLDIDNKSDKSIFIPAEIGKFTSLERLTASGCSLIGIDPQIGKCQKLIYIDISHNPLFSLPNALQSCQILMSLDISECNFDKVPQCVFELVKLVSLNV
ncbi:MAG: hypothetical protein LLF94_00825, partial [Chlamydiales bacterium]|nr:hypothetical protein [Chlamydiales bacterium]